MDTWDIRTLDLEPHQPQVLSSDKEMRVIALNLPAGEMLQEHQVHERALLMVADGAIEVTQDSATIAGGPGFVAEWRPAERHEVKATSDARVVLVLAPWPGVGHPSERRVG